MSKFGTLEKPVHLPAVAQVTRHETQVRQLRLWSGFTSAVRADHIPSLGLKELYEV